MDFTDKTVLITGATSGIGRAAATAFARAGATVAANHLNQPEAIESLANELSDSPGRVFGCHADVRRADQVRTMVEQILDGTGGIDILVNNAGISIVKPFLETTEEDWDRILDTDLRSVFLCCQAVLPGMLERGSGTVINVASELGYLGRANFSAYTAAKGGVITLTRSLAREFAPTLRINGVAPGPTWTPMLEQEAAVPGHEESLDDIPVRRYGRPEEIAASILFLASEHAGFYCGEIISPNGGVLMR